MRILFPIFTLLISFSTWATPSSIIFMRHAEEPKGDEGIHLSKKGKKRASLLPILFKTHPELLKRGRPVALIGMKPKDNNGSVRSIETLKDLSEDLRLPILSPSRYFETEELAALVNSRAEFDNKTIVIVWQHATLDKLVEEFGLKKVKKWDHDDFDRLWIVDFKKNKPERFLNLPQRLLPGDSAE